MSHINPTTKKLYHASVNACLAPLVSVDGKHVITVEGIGDVKNPHAIQQRMAVGNGSQCGFCTPGIVMVKRPDYHCLVNTAELIVVFDRVSMHLFVTTLNLLNMSWKRHSMGIFVGVRAIDLS